MQSSEQPVVVRMAPSPTGLFHVGSLRTAIYNYLYARKHKGAFILRIEDTDSERSKKEYEQNILEAFDWLELHYDALYRQSERTDIYKKYIEKLIQEGNAYEAEENASGTGKVIRFKNPNTTITFTDEILGEVSFDITELGDFVIARDIDHPLYHLTVVVDDGEMGVTHVIRGQDHVSNTPRQIALLEACGFTRPTYAHIPLILSSDKTKLSKRHGAVAVTEYKEQGYLKDSLINFMSFIGWNPGGEEEIFPIGELAQLFELSSVQKSPGVFNTEKLDWINKQWLMKLSDEEFTEYIKKTTEPLWSQSEDTFKKLLPIIRERIHNLVELQTMIDTGEFDLYYKDIRPHSDKLTWKETPAEQIKKHLEHIMHTIQDIDINQYNSEYVKSLIWPYAEEKGKGEVLAPLRYALTGRDKSPDPFTVAEILGKEITIKRIRHALSIL